MSHHEFPYLGSYMAVRGHSMHYIDQDPQDGVPVVMLHGNRSWSYAYRNFIPYLVSAGYRAIALDHVGFGRSDKPVAVEDYTFAFHTANLGEFIQGLGLERLVLLGQEWGGIMALDYAIKHPGKLWALVLMNSGPFLATRIPLWSRMVTHSSLGAVLIRRFNLTMQDLGSKHGVYYRENLDKDVASRYSAPFPNFDSRAGILAFRRMVPAGRKHPSWSAIKAIQDQLANLTVPVLVIGAKSDRAFGIPEARALKARLPHSELRILDDGGHLLQEDRPDLLSRWIVDFLQRVKEAGIGFDKI